MSFFFRKYTFLACHSQLRVKSGHLARDVQIFTLIDLLGLVKVSHVGASFGLQHPSEGIQGDCLARSWRRPKVKLDVLALSLNGLVGWHKGSKSCKQINVE